MTSTPTDMRPAVAARANIGPLVRASRPRTTTGLPFCPPRHPSAAAWRATSSGVRSLPTMPRMPDTLIINVSDMGGKVGGERDGVGRRADGWSAANRAEGRSGLRTSHAFRPRAVPPTSTRRSGTRRIRKRVQERLDHRGIELARRQQVGARSQASRRGIARPVGPALVMASNASATATMRDSSGIEITLEPVGESVAVHPLVVGPHDRAAPAAHPRISGARIRAPIDGCSMMCWYFVGSELGPACSAPLRARRSSRCRAARRPGESCSSISPVLSPRRSAVLTAYSADAHGNGPAVYGVFRFEGVGQGLHRLEEQLLDARGLAP